ncbi:hypothetical protein L1987_70548 [Smallanthus sonchifolius]|uniref:Uncharacterized protein n=1 Tax=Smallanthus sonchifolius TaxID=185202 RepID=A0ACB9AQS1_9ASTR|nr:hypothetical protein L1987_70548 [Smallanthus sonchifolius]
MGGIMPLRNVAVSQPIPVGALASSLANASPTEQRTLCIFFSYHSICTLCFALAVCLAFCFESEGFGKEGWKDRNFMWENVVHQLAKHLGVVAEEDIMQGEFLIEYVGEGAVGATLAKRLPKGSSLDDWSRNYPNSQPQHFPIQ